MGPCKNVGFYSEWDADPLKGFEQSSDIMLCFKRIIPAAVLRRICRWQKEKDQSGDLKSDSKER